ncbi:inactive protein RESTRICTED TEV MOVEMENT 1-like [Solanum verrucosum]|uniref:inactive protein RESTRICTED TEV MOVEMENT 1-like n=1 Tax=Solanum verrucosum TaxID=315347 RepID=UPI0020D1DF02|nr:inactive protein RESTRICTED TEV MOVEMENT 1-like [Solanum verrucosum]
MNLIKVGPAGGKRGTVWDEKGKGEIAKFFFSYDEIAVYSLQFLFVENGNFVLSDTHGPAHNNNFTTVVLDHPSEFLTSIRGFHDRESPDTFIYLRSITFGTNKGTYGPYGMKTLVNYKLLKEFNFEIGDDRTFGGFHGTKYGGGIESIGVYVKAVTSSMIKPGQHTRKRVKTEQG